MKLVYVAGPYRGPTPHAVQLNIECARRVGVLVAKAGLMPVIPHANTGGLEFVAPDIGDEFWLEGTLEMMRRCDAVVLCPGWEQSAGTRAEVAEADRLGIPVFQTVTRLIEWTYPPGCSESTF